MALIVMTVLAAFAGAFVLGFAYTRLRVPLVLTLAVWLGAYLVLDVGYPHGRPALRGRSEPAGPGIALHQEQHRHDAAGLQPDRLDRHDVHARLHRHPIDRRQRSRRRSRTSACGTTGRSARPSTGCRSIRQYYSFADVDTDRYTFTDAASCSPQPAPCVRQVMIAGRELDRDPACPADQRRPELGQPAHHLHPRLRPGHGPGQRGRPAAASRTC